MKIKINLNGCSTFLIRDDDNFLIGHNLDETFHVPGMVIFNKRGERKRSHGFTEWLEGKTTSTPSITWEARFGSLSFNAFGRDLPDGGINEAGLYVQEMTLVDTQFPEYPERPQMFMVVWLQYILDTCATIEQALVSLDTIALDGWSWHFFLCDAEGKTAVVEFPAGERHIYRGDDMPIPVLCNTEYPEELENLSQYTGFGGDIVADINNKKGFERFAQAAHMIQHVHGNPVDHAFNILDNLVRNGTQWSYVIDVKNGQAYFHTHASPTRKQVSLSAFDYSNESPSKVIDIDSQLEGDVTASFEDYSFAFNQALMEKQIANIDSDGGLTEAMETFSNTKENFIATMAGYPEE